MFQFKFIHHKGHEGTRRKKIRYAGCDMNKNKILTSRKNGESRGVRRSTNNSYKIPTLSGKERETRVGAAAKVLVDKFKNQKPHSSQKQALRQAQDKL
jgi:hypothetical protein